MRQHTVFSDIIRLYQPINEIYFHYFKLSMKFYIYYGYIRKLERAYMET